MLTRGLPVAIMSLCMTTWPPLQVQVRLESGFFSCCSFGAPVSTHPVCVLVPLVQSKQRNAARSDSSPKCEPSLSQRCEAGQQGSLRTGGSAGRSQGLCDTDQPGPSESNRAGDRRDVRGSECVMRCRMMRAAASSGGLVDVDAATKASQGGSDKVLERS